MASRVIRYRFENNLGERQLQLPEGAEILDAGHFNGAVALWVKAPELEVGEAPPAMELRRFVLVAVGQTFDEQGGRFVGTSIAAGHEVLIFELETKSLEERLETATNLLEEIASEIDRRRESL